jgi:hypothetical protein
MLIIMESFLVKGFYRDLFIFQLFEFHLLSIYSYDCVQTGAEIS